MILRSSNDGNISGFLDMLEMVHAKLPEMEIILATLATDFPEDGWDVTHWRAGESTYRTGTLAWSGMEDAWISMLWTNSSEIWIVSEKNVFEHPVG